MNITHYKDLNSKHVFITGAGSGIGAAFVSALIEQGSHVSFISLDHENAEPLCDKIVEKFGIRPFYQHCDVSDIARLTACIKNAVDIYGDIEVLINNAAQDTRHTLMDLSPDEWDSSININLRPHFFTVQAVATAMKNNGGGSIINLSSNSVLLGLSGYPAYISAKAAIIGLTKSLARELGPNNIRVNALLPGWVMTQRQKQLWVTPEALQECLDQQCLKKTISENDVANSALFLASEASAMITGQCLIIDAGRV